MLYYFPPPLLLFYNIISESGRGGYFIASYFMCRRGKTCFTWPIGTHRWLYTSGAQAHHSISFAGEYIYAGVYQVFAGAVAKDQIMTGASRVTVIGWNDVSPRVHVIYINLWSWRERYRFFSLFYSNPNERTNKHEKKKKKKTSRLSAAIWFQFSRQHFG